MTDALQRIARQQARKIKRCLAGVRTPFWLASFPGLDPAAHLPELHRRGFDNYPHCRIPIDDPLFFLERLLGGVPAPLDGVPGDYFRTWCEPVIRSPGDVRRCLAGAPHGPAWSAYGRAIDKVVGTLRDGGALPVVAPGFSLLDCACNLCGTESFFLWLYEAEAEAHALLDGITDLYLQVWRELTRRKLKTVNYFGFPGTYCNDLQMGQLSPGLVAKYLLPRYARIADACGGLMLSLNCTDRDIMKQVLAMEQVTGCAFDRRLPLAAIRRHLGTKVFVLAHYAYDPALDRPTCRDGLWWNPIVNTYSREVEEVYRVLAGRHSLLILIERPTLAEVCRVRARLSNGRGKGQKHPTGTRQPLNREP